jgi:hypothetical protein
MLNGDCYLSDTEPRKISEGYIRPARRGPMAQTQLRTRPDMIQM